MHRLRPFLIWSARGLIVAIAMLVLAGQTGCLQGQPPGDLGVKDGRLKPPSPTPNSVSSQAMLYPGHPQRDYADIQPIAYSTDAARAMEQMVSTIQTTEGCRVTRREIRYIRAECTTRWLRFTDDLELWLDQGQHTFHVRSASRLGRKDFGTNRRRVEAIRAGFSR